MGPISALTVLLFTSGILLSNHRVNGQAAGHSGGMAGGMAGGMGGGMGGGMVQPTAAPEVTLVFETTTEAGVVLISSDACPSHVQSGLGICHSFVGLGDLVNLLATSDFNVCSYSLQQYACTNLTNVSEDRAFDIVNCVLSNNNAIFTQGAFSLFFSKLSVNTIGSVLNRINHMVASSSITAKSREYLLNAVWEKLRQDPENLIPGVLAAWFQEKLYAFLPAINPEILNCVSTTTVTCDGLLAIVRGLDMHYSTYDNATRAEIGMWITRFINSHSCNTASLANSITTFYQSFKADMNFEDFKIAFGNQDFSTALTIFSGFQMQQYVKTSNAFESTTSASVVFQELEARDFAFSIEFYNSLPADNYNSDVRFFLLNNLLNKLNSAVDPLCRPQVKTIFQGKLSYLFTAINDTILQKFAPVDCSEFQDLYQGVDIIHEQLSNENKQLVYQYRKRFLTNETAKSGSGCTYGLNSVTWLESNFGRSVEFATYAELISFNANFDGYQAFRYLNTQQSIDLFISTEIFTSASPIEIETRVKSVTDIWKSKSYTYMQLFVRELRTVLIKYNIRIILNYQVRFQFLESIWGVMKTQFSHYIANDWYSLTESLSYFTSAISSEQLSDLSISVVQDCSNMQRIVGGLGIGYGDMNGNTKSDVTNWISGFLKDEQHHCTGGSGDWLVENYKEFIQEVNISTIRQINTEYNVENSIELFAPDQLGQLIVQSTEAHTNVTIVERVFEVLITTDTQQSMENIGSFWDSFIVEYEKAVNFSNEVKHYMLSTTVTEISSSFVNFTSQETTLWFEERMYPVMPVIDSEVLSEISLDVGCGFQTSFVKAVSVVYDEILPTSKEDVITYLQSYLQNQQNRPEGQRCITQETSTVSYVQEYFGEYRSDITYSQMTTYFSSFNVFESGAFQILTTEQFGDMIVQEKVYESETKVNQVFQYLQTQSIETVNSIMTRFSETAYTQNIQIQDATIGQSILQHYCNQIRTSVTTYTTKQIRQMFTTRISVLIQFFTRQTLSIFVVRDCDTLVVIVAELSKSFSRMSESTRTEIINWILSILKSSSLNGCTSSYTTTKEWIDSTMKEFFQYTSLKEVLQINSQLDTLQIITETSDSQKAEYLCSSNVLTNATVTMTVLEALKGEDNVTSSQEVVSFLGEFNTVYSQLNTQTMTSEVRQEAMTYLFESYISDFNSLTVEQISSFSVYFEYFISGVTSELAQTIPLNMNCDAYKSIFGGFSSVDNELSDDAKGALFKRIINYMDFHDTSSSDVCSSLYTDSRSYIQTIFQNFSSEATIYQFEEYNAKFDAYSCVDVFSSTQLGNLLMNTTAIKDQMEAVQILVELKKRDYEEVRSFLTEVNVVAEEKSIAKLPDSNIQDLMFQTVWQTVTENVKTSADYKEWFDGTLDLVISSAKTSDIASLSTDIDCSSQSYVVKSFSGSFSELDDDQKSAMYKRIKDFNKGVKESTGSACAAESGGQWIQEYYGSFKELASITDFQAENSNFNAALVLNEFTGSQVAEYAIQVGALRNEETLRPVLESLDTTKEVKDFLTQCNSVAREELQSSSFGEEILERTFQVYSEEINHFQTSEWQEWSQVTLQNIIQNVNETQLEKIQYPLTCASYQELVTGFNNVYDIMSEDSRKAVYGKCIKPQFNSVVSMSGVKCGQPTENVEVWVETNFAKFSSYVQVSEYVEWNSEYKATDVIGFLSADQLADVAVSAVTNEEVACQIAARVQEFDASEVNGFLGKLSGTLKEKGITSMTNVVGSKFLSSSLSVISSTLSSYSSAEWADLMSVKLQPLVFSIDSDQLTILLGSADCNSYRSIFQQLNKHFDNFAPDNRQSLFNVLYGFISKKKTDSGFCRNAGEDSRASITNLVGRFSSYMTVSQVKEIDSSFNWVVDVEILNTNQLADVSFSENIFSDAVKANAVISRLATMSFTDVDLYLRAFQANANAAGILATPDGAVKTSFFSAVFSKVSGQFAVFTSSQWNDYFGSFFNWFFTSFQASQINQIPDTISCAALQSVVSGASKFYRQLQGDVQSALYGKINSVLNKQKESRGNACPSNIGSSDWLLINYGAMRVKASIAEIVSLNSNFIVTEAVLYLSPEQLGAYMADNSVLSDKDKIEKVMAVFNSQTIGSFLASFNAACAKNGIKGINNAANKKFLLGEIMCKAGSGFASFTADSYDDFFQNKLKLFLSSFDAKAFGFIPSELGCDALANIIKSLSAVENPENPTVISNFVSSVLGEKQASTGFACTDGNIDTRTWLKKFYGLYVRFAPWTSIIQFYPNFDMTSSSDLLTETQLAEASSEVTIIHNVTVITNVMATVSGDINSLYNYIDVLWRAVATNPDLLSNKVKEVVVGAVAKNVLTQFHTLPTQSVEDWMTKIHFLLPTFNATILDYIDPSIDCPPFQSVVSVMEPVYTSFTPVRQQAVADFILKTLRYKAAHGDDPCTSGTTTTSQWINKNVGSYCSHLSADDMAAVNPGLDKVSYQRICTFT